MEIEIRNHQYQPSTVRGKRGTTFTWTNQDQVDHTVTALDQSWDSGRIPPGGKYSLTIHQEGEYRYYCTIHPKMRGTIKVSNTPLPTPTPSSSNNSSQGINYCREYREKGFDCEIPEVNAIKTDFWLISRDIEYAIVIPHRKKICRANPPPRIRDMVLRNLNSAQEWFDDIVMYLNLYSELKVPDLTKYVRKVQGEIDSLKEKVRGVRNMKELQQVSLRNIYGFHGVLGGLKTRVNQEFIRKVS